jgi:hypothetical protein
VTELVAKAADAKAADDERSLQLQRFSRLMGISLKEPFAKPHDVPPSSSATGAHRTWLLDDAMFDSEQVRSSWQYSLLDKLRSEEWIPTHRNGFRPTDVRNLANDTHYERGFFWYLAKSAHEYICGDKALETQLQAAVNELQKRGALRR